MPARVSYSTRAALFAFGHGRVAHETRIPRISDQRDADLADHLSSTRPGLRGINGLTGRGFRAPPASRADGRGAMLRCARQPAVVSGAAHAA